MRVRQRLLAACLSAIASIALVLGCALGNFGKSMGEGIITGVFGRSSEELKTKYDTKEFREKIKAFQEELKKELDQIEIKKIFPHPFLLECAVVSEKVDGLEAAKVKVVVKISNHKDKIVYSMDAAWLQKGSESGLKTEIRMAAEKIANYLNSINLNQQD
jgi:hypothetical protein